MQLPFIITFWVGETIREINIWADEVEIGNDGILILFDYLEEGVRQSKAAFTRWEFFYIDEDMEENEENLETTEICPD